MMSLKKSLIFSVSALVLCVPSVMADSAVKTFDIRSQFVSAALKEFSQQANIKIVYLTENIKNLSTAGLKGSYSLEEALEILLAGSNLEYEYVGENTVAIREVRINSSTGNEETRSEFDENLYNFLIEEIIVTATKRSSKIQDTAMSISAIGRKEIERRGLVGMGDYLNSLPSVSVLDTAAAKTAVVIRGLGANPQIDGLHGATVGIYFGETPISGLGISGLNADVKMVDIERVEVLKGPQGTLYGSSTMGGTVRNIPVAPNLQKLEGKIRLGYSNTAGFGSDNSELQGIINIPLIEDMLAVRAVAYRFNNSGFYKNIAASDSVTAAAAATWGASAIDRDDIGSDQYIGGRLSMLWQPTDELTISLSYLDQEIEQDGWPQADLVLGEGAYLQRRFQIRHAEGEPDFGKPEFDEMFSDKLDITNVTIEYDFTWGSALSSSSWVNENSQQYREIGSLIDYLPWTQLTDFDTDAFVQEFRLLSHSDEPLQFLLGLYFEDIETLTVNWGLFGGDPARNPFTSLKLLGGKGTNVTQQTALYGEISYDLTETVMVTVGGRQYYYETSGLSVSDVTPLEPLGFISSGKSDDNGSNYKLGIDFTPSDDTLIYFSWSEGFRLGGSMPANTNPLCDQNGDGFYDGSDGVTTGPSQIDSDVVENFELGSKFSLLNNRLQISTDIYRFNWEGIPITVQFGLCSTTLNAGKAKSQGFELEGTYAIDDSLLFNFGSSYLKAELTEDAPNLGNRGDRLPGSPEYNVSLGLQYEFVIAGYHSFIRSDYSYVGGFYNNLQESGPEIGDYAKLNVRAGVRMGRVDVELFMNNLTNEDNFTWIDSEGFTNLRGYQLRPRTVGFNIGYQL